MCAESFSASRDLVSCDEKLEEQLEFDEEHLQEMMHNTGRCEKHVSSSQ